MKLGNSLPSSSLEHEIDKAEYIGEADFLDLDKCLSETIKKYITLLLTGKKKQALNILIKLYQDLGMEDLCLDVLAKGLEYIDYQWQQDKADLSEEHYIAQVTKDFLAYLRYSGWIFI